jgi:hypothetical protein
MKKVILLLFVFSIMLDLTAQKQSKLDTLNIDQLNIYKDKAIKLRNAGMIVTFTGVVIIAAGWITSNIMSGIDKPDEYLEDVIPYILGISVGVPTAIIGIPIWVIGGIKKSKAEVAIMKFDIKPENSMAVGLGITIRF